MTLEIQLGEPKANASNHKIPLNLLLKGVPGTGKSLLVNNLIKQLNIASDNVLRINIHSASSNADLMQGISVTTTTEKQVQYAEKTGLVLDLINKAICLPNKLFALVLEEIQENSLNELIGDLIYLIEEDKRTDVSQLKFSDSAKKEVVYSFEDMSDLIEKTITKPINYISMPYLVSSETKIKKLIFPKNIYVFCTSNYRDDRKIIEDNLLRRFDLMELYPKYDLNGCFEPKVLKWLEQLNTNILQVMTERGEIHPDRYLIGHAVFKGVYDLDSDYFARALLKVITEFKDIREIDFATIKSILAGLYLPIDSSELQNYIELIRPLQDLAYTCILIPQNVDDTQSNQPAQDDVDSYTQFWRRLLDNNLDKDGKMGTPWENSNRDNTEINDDCTSQNIIEENQQLGYFIKFLQDGFFHGIYIKDLENVNTYQMDETHYTKLVASFNELIMQNDPDNLIELPEAFSVKFEDQPHTRDGVLKAFIIKISQANYKDIIKRESSDDIKAIWRKIKALQPIIQQLVERHFKDNQWND